MGLRGGRDLSQVPAKAYAAPLIPGKTDVYIPVGPIPLLPKRSREETKKSPLEPESPEVSVQMGGGSDFDFSKTSGTNFGKPSSNPSGEFAVEVGTEDMGSLGGSFSSSPKSTVFAFQGNLLVSRLIFGNPEETAQLILFKEIGVDTGLELNHQLKRVIPAIFGNFTASLIHLEVKRRYWELGFDLGGVLETRGEPQPEGPQDSERMHWRGDAKAGGQFSTEFRVFPGGGPLFIYVNAELKVVTNLKETNITPLVFGGVGLTFPSRLKQPKDR
jgi:hypothetical protein